MTPGVTRKVKREECDESLPNPPPPQHPGTRHAGVNAASLQKWRNRAEVEILGRSSTRLHFWLLKVEQECPSEAALSLLLAGNPGPADAVKTGRVRAGQAGGWRVYCVYSVYWVECAAVMRVQGV
jgi:hypothetical protein